MTASAARAQMATCVASNNFGVASGQAVQSGLLIVGTPSSQAVRSGLLIVGTLCYFLGGLLCLCGALRRWRVATEAKPVQANTPSPPNAAAQQVASTIESLAVYSAWHAANHRSFMFADAARDLEARRRAGERLQALLTSTAHSPHTAPSLALHASLTFHLPTRSRPCRRCCRRSSRRRSRRWRGMRPGMRPTRGDGSTCTWRATSGTSRRASAGCAASSASRRRCLARAARGGRTWPRRTSRSRSNPNPNQG